ncbi:hypothetical protein ACPCK9_32250 [Streptomyces koyangensis]|uniref:hypothetical protein n=1 Tax=Streptomyces koyangensis TaxID=188770 RepID=UPI003C2E3AC6
MKTTSQTRALEKFRAASRAAIASGSSYTDRRARAAAAALRSGLPLAEAAKAVGISESVFSRLAKRGREQGKGQQAPDATSLGIVDLDSPVGQAERRETVHTGQIPALISDDPQSREDAVKRSIGITFGRSAVVDREAAAMGTRHVPTLASLFAERHPEYDVLESGMWQGHDERPYQRASPDRVLVSAGDSSLSVVSVLTVTTRPKPFTEEWGPDGSDQVPAWLAARKMWEMDTLGVKEARVIACAQGAYVREYHLTWDEARAKELRHLAVKFLAGVADLSPAE